MKPNVIIPYLILFGILFLFIAACNREEERSVPRIVEAEIANSVEFGDSVSFRVTVEDSSPVQSVTASVWYDGEETSRTTLREGVDGVFEGRLLIPAVSGVDNGDYEVMFLALNSVSGHSEVTTTISCSHADYAYIDFVSTTGDTYRFLPSGTLYEYEITGTFPGQLSGYFCSPEPSDEEYSNGKRQLTWGASGSSIVSGSTASIILINSDEDEVQNVTLKFNQLDMTTDVPMLPSTFSLTSDNMSATKTLQRGQTIYFEGLPDGCWIDVDFFEKADADDGYTFLAEDGSYKITREDTYNYIRVERMSGSDYATYDGASVNMAIWCIGNSEFGKPDKNNEVNWNTDKGLCMSKIADDTYQLTVKLYFGFSIKFYWQKGWGGEFQKSNYASVESAFFGSTDDGNMQQAEDESLSNIYATEWTDDNKWYRITLDVSGGSNAVRLTCIELDENEL